MADEYIRKQDAIIEMMDNDVDHTQGIDGREIVQILEDIPAADVAPVVHSRWSDEMERVDTYHPFAGFETDYYHRCLKCGHRGKGFSWNFCPYCGAKMDGEE